MQAVTGGDGSERRKGGVETLLYGPQVLGGAAMVL